MASLRNHDQVVFLDRQTGLLEKWTLGEDDNYNILYEQHNPDYIPAARGGPAVVVADSENDRVVEYQRKHGRWVQTWVYEERDMGWVRDADRLPNGNTLIADTHGNRVIEVAPNGSIVYEVEYPKPYEVERLGTGDESAGGQSASRLGLSNHTVKEQLSNATTSASLKWQIIQLVPSKVRHGILWVLPPWVTFFDFILISISILLSLLWITLEVYWTERISVRSPVILR